MDQIQIGLWVTAGLLVMVVMGMRVAFAAALAGVVGLILIFWAKKDIFRPLPPYKSTKQV